MASGGRYDTLIRSLWEALPNWVPAPVGAVGLCLSLERLAKCVPPTTTTTHTRAPTRVWRRCLARPLLPGEYTAARVVASVAHSFPEARTCCCRKVRRRMCTSCNVQGM